MEEGQTKEAEINMVFIAIPLLIAIAGFLGWWFLIKSGPESKEGEESRAKVSQAEPERGVGSNEAMEAAIAKAKGWSKDARLVTFSSKEGATGNKTGKSEFWTFLFTAEEKPKKGYEVVVKNSTNSPSIYTSSEVPYGSSTRAVKEIAPSDIITQEEAIAKVREIPGYENVTVLEVEAEYGPLGEIWYWNVKTDKAGVSIHALRNED